MKKVLHFSAFLTVLIFMLQTGVSSCTKEKTFYDTVNIVKNDTVIKKDTVVKNDTIIVKDTTVSLQLLTANSWKTQEIKGVQGNSVVSYERGATGNTESFDNEYITFNDDKTGVYVEEAGIPHQLTWDFTNSEKTKLTFTMENPPPGTNHTVVYENIRYKNGALLFDQYWTYNNVNTHAQLVRTPR